MHADAAADLVHRSEGSWTENLDPLQLRLLQDAQLSLVGGRPTGGQGLHQLRWDMQRQTAIDSVYQCWKHQLNVLFSSTYNIFRNWCTHSCSSEEMKSPPKNKTWATLSTPISIGFDIQIFHPISAQILQTHVKTSIYQQFYLNKSAVKIMVMHVRL